jgi:hypothetical protein
MLLMYDSIGRAVGDCPRCLFNFLNYSMFVYEFEWRSVKYLTYIRYFLKMNFHVLFIFPKF